MIASHGEEDPALASREFHALQARLAAQPQPAPPSSLQEWRAYLDALLGGAPLAERVEEQAVDAGGVAAIWLQRNGGARDPVLAYFHGGGYRIGSARAWRAYGSHLALACRARVLLIDYRLAPEHPFPAAVEDAVAAVHWLLASGEAPRRIVLGGDSAGGGLAAAALVALRDRGGPLPAGAVCLSPWADLTNRSRTYVTRAETDRLFSHKQAQEAAALYLAGQAADHPLASPVFADWRGLPPLLIHAGDVEVLLDDALCLASCARAAGVDVRLAVYPDMPHVWHISYPAFPEAVWAVEEVAAFVRERTDGA
jgi:acetyl esterase/lipase